MDVDDVDVKENWIKNYKEYINEYKEEEFGLLHFFLINDYHLNKTYKKYSYNENIYNSPEINFLINRRKKYKFLYDDLFFCFNDNRIDKTTKMNNLKTKKEQFRKLNESTKTEIENNYKNLLSKENELYNELKNYNQNKLNKKDNEINNFFKDYENTEATIKKNNLYKNFKDKAKIINQTINANTINNQIINNTFNISSNHKYFNSNLITNTSSIGQIKTNLLDINKHTEKKNPIKLKTNRISLEIKASAKSINFNNINNYIIPKKDIIYPLTKTKNLDNYSDPLDNFLDYICFNISNDSSKSCHLSNISIKTVTSNSVYTYNNIKEKNDNYKFDELISYLNNLNFNENITKSMNYFSERIKKINEILQNDIHEKDNLGWEFREHNEFIKLCNAVKGKFNTYNFLANLKNLFPYKKVKELKQHIKLYQNYLKIIEIKNNLEQKYFKIKKKFNDQKKNQDICKNKCNCSVDRLYNNKKKTLVNIKNNCKFGFYSNQKITGNFSTKSLNDIKKDDSTKNSNLKKNKKNKRVYNKSDLGINYKYLSGNKTKNKTSVFKLYKNYK